jgi:hypothetical protein
MSGATARLQFENANRGLVKKKFFFILFDNARRAS